MEENYDKRLFLRCGERFDPPPGADWDVLTLPHPLTPADLPEAVRRVRRAVAGTAEVGLLIAGPVALGVALGQSLAHVPTKIVYLQIDQTTKRIEPWCDNTLDW